MWTVRSQNITADKKVTGGKILLSRDFNLKFSILKQRNLIFFYQINVFI